MVYLRKGTKMGVRGVITVPWGTEHKVQELWLTEKEEDWNFYLSVTF